MNVYYLTPEMKTPSVIRTLELVPGVSVIEGFHCRDPQLEKSEVSL